jgi:aspartyl-tRNA(Asn)/glutamyl-tRNA(Gln) amidotransferase subunit C
MLSKDEVKHIAALARIGMDEKEIEKFSGELSGILDWIKQLDEVETKNVQPIGHITGMKNAVREDKIVEFENKEAIIGLFPERKDNFDKVKSVL